MTARPYLILALCTTFSLSSLPAIAAPAKITIAAPSSGEEVKGQITVLVKAQSNEVPKGLYVGVGKSCWTEMVCDKESGDWTGTLDSSLIPNGRRTVEVFTDNRKTRAEVEVNVKNTLKVFFSNLHSHSSYSDGAFIPSVAHDYARDIAKLDVFCLTDHLESVDDAEWRDTREAAWKANQDGRFVAFPGLEWTKKWGHINIYDPNARRWPVDPHEFYKACAKARVIAKFNHPGDGTKSHGGLEYSKIGDQAVQLMEVRKAEEEKAYIRALNKGWHIAPDGSDDTHGPNWGMSRAWSGILAPGLSRENILDALSKRHCYSTLDRNCVLQFKIGDAVMGDIVEEPMKTVDVHVEVNDPDKGDATAKIELYEDGKVVKTNEPGTEHCFWELRPDSSPGSHYYFVKVTQADGNQLWSAPIWVMVGE